MSSNGILPFQISAYQVYSSLKKFGAVKEVKFFCKYDVFYYYYWVFVEFDDCQYAEAALSKSLIKIGDVTLKIKPCKMSDCYWIFKEWKTNVKNNNELYLHVPDENSPNNILNVLNDDCLREICQKLPFRDLCSLLRVCVRFNEISQEYLAKEPFDVWSFAPLTLQQTNDYLSNFGSLITKIKIGKYYGDVPWPLSHEHCFWGMISEHCINIRKIVVSDLVDLHLFSELIPMFGRLKALHFQTNTSETNRSINSILPVCSQLKALSIKTSDYLPPIKMPSLVAIRLYNVGFLSSLESFLSLNTQIEIFSFFSGFGILCDGKHYSLLGSLKRLRALKIMVSWRDPPYKIKHLLQELLSNNLQIEYLTIEGMNIENETIDYIAQMKTICMLSLRHGSKFDENYFIKLASNLPHLKAVLFERECQIELILTDKIIHQIEKDLQKIIPSVNLHIQELKSSKNTFKDHYTVNYQNNRYKYKTAIYSESSDESEYVYKVSLTIREVIENVLILLFT